MLTKVGVRLDGLQPEIQERFWLLDAVCRAWFGRECVITSAREGVHKEGSLHGSGFAVDIRTNDQLPVVVRGFVVDLRVQLGKGYDVVLEKDHVHVEYDPEV